MCMSFGAGPCLINCSFFCTKYYALIRSTLAWTIPLILTAYNSCSYTHRKQDVTITWLTIQRYLKDTTINFINYNSQFSNHPTFFSQSSMFKPMVKYLPPSFPIYSQFVKFHLLNAAFQHRGIRWPELSKPTCQNMCCLWFIFLIKIILVNETNNQGISHQYTVSICKFCISVTFNS